MKRKITPKSKDLINEAVDIINNSEDDESAVVFLQDTLEDDFPELDLGTMDLHEAIKVLEKEEIIDNKTKKKDNKEKLNKMMDSLDELRRH